MINKIKLLIGILASAFLAAPVVALGQNNAANVNTLMTFIGTTAQSFYRVLLAFSVIAVVWGLFKFVIHADDETARAEGRKVILWGVISIFLLLSIWGLVNILIGSFALNNTAIPVPVLRTSNP